MSLRAFFVGGFLLALISAAAVAITGSDHENVSPYGIWAMGDSVVVFAQVYPCPPDELPPPGAAQLFVSRDGGAHWEKSGPRIEGSEFEYVREAGTRLWIVGEHTAEGPASEPFILVPEERNDSWKLHVMYEGASELKGVAIQKNGEFTARIRHLRLRDNGWAGPLYVHKSSDGGRTWSVVGQEKKEPLGPGELFKKIGQETATWRVVDRGDGHSAIEHRDNEHSVWKPIEGFNRNGCGL